LTLNDPEDASYWYVPPLPMGSPGSLTSVREVSAIATVERSNSHATIPAEARNLGESFLAFT
jgi:hypothetical protein